MVEQCGNLCVKFKCTSIAKHRITTKERGSLEVAGSYWQMPMYSKAYSMSPKRLLHDFVHNAWFLNSLLESNKYIEM